MESELDLLLGTVIDSLLKLELLLLLHSRGASAHRAEELAGPLGRPPEVVARALDELAGAGLVARFPLGRGRHVLYGASEEGHVRELLELLRARYQRDPESRASLARAVMGGEARQPEPPTGTG